MIEKELEIINKLGLHARAAAKLVGVTSAFGATIHIQKESKRVDGKSIMAVMMLAASKGSTLTISCDGADEIAAMTAIETLIYNKFDEGQ